MLNVVQITPYPFRETINTRNYQYILCTFCGGHEFKTTHGGTYWHIMHVCCIAGGTDWHIMHVCCIASQCACMHQHSLPCIDCNVFCTCMYDIYMYVASRITLCVCTCIHICVLLHHCMHMPLHLCIQFALSCRLGAGMTTSV